LETSAESLKNGRKHTSINNDSRRWINPLPLPGPITGNLVCHTTFVTLYADETADPWQGDYQPIMDRVDLEMNRMLTPLLLLEQAVGAGPVPQAYLCCSLQRNQVRIYCLHIPSKYVGALDGRLSPWDGNSYAFLGEITQGVATTVNFPNTSFNPVMNVRSKTSDYIVTHLDALGNKGLPPTQADEPDTELVSTRRVIYLPARYVPLLLSPAGYTLRQTWDLLYPALVTNNDLVRCAALIKWLRVITMGTPVPNNPNDIGPTSAITDLVPLVGGPRPNQSSASYSQTSSAGCLSTGPITRISNYANGSSGHPEHQQQSIGA
jgi:hypothetical protein